MEVVCFDDKGPVIIAGTVNNDGLRAHSVNEIPKPVYDKIIQLFSKKSLNDETNQIIDVCDRLSVLSQNHFKKLRMKVKEYQNGDILFHEFHPYIVLGTNDLFPIFGINFVDLSDGRLLTDTSTQKEMLEKALQSVGNPYVWGNDKISQFDCSKIVYWAFKTLCNL